MTPDRQLYPDGTWIFIAGAGEEVHDGKGYYPAALKISIDRYEALQCLESLARQLRYAQEQRIILNWSGTIHRLDDEPSDP